MSAGRNVREGAREKVLVRVRRALEDARTAGRIPALSPEARGSGSPAAPPIEESIVRQITPASPDALWPRFVARLEALGDRAIRVQLREEARAALAKTIEEQNLKRGVIDADARAWLEIADGTRLGPATLDTAGDRTLAFEVDFGITLCDLAVAEMGTLVLGAGEATGKREGRARFTSLAPPTHFAIVPFSRLVADVLDATTRAAIPSVRNAVWITGSSRTADIEGNIVRGVHGPRQILVVGVADA